MQTEKEKEKRRRTKRKAERKEMEDGVTQHQIRRYLDSVIEQIEQS